MRLGMFVILIQFTINIKRWKNKVQWNFWDSKHHQPLKGFTDRGVLLLQLGHDGWVVPLAGHEKPEHLLPVFGHDKL